MGGASIFDLFRVVLIPAYLLKARVLHLGMDLIGLPPPPPPPAFPLRRFHGCPLTHTYVAKPSACTLVSAGADLEDTELATNVEDAEEDIQLEVCMCRRSTL